MKILIRFFIILIITFWIFTQIHAGVLSDIFTFWNNWEVNLCKWNDCTMQWWQDEVKKALWNDIETDKKFSEYIVDVVKYILTFVSLIAVIYIMYAWFMILTWAWDEEKIKSSKKTILYVIIWMIVIWFAYSITAFVIMALNWKTT